ncbi:MAG: outer membrane beta-barrel protein [Bacteroidales bacterium]|nr:outer membrane beta-barrel protein [Bacteroidales bacterium]
MKKLFITLAFVAAAFFAQAQLFVGGSLGFNSTKDPLHYQGNVANVEKVTTISVLPTVGFMFADNMGVGADFGMVYTKEKPATGDDVKTTEFVIAPFFRYVFAEVDNFTFYGDLKADLKFGKIKGMGDDIKTSTVGFGIVPGMSYSLTDNISMVASLNILRLGYTQTKVGDDKEKAFGFGVNENTPINLGFVYTF